MGESSAEQPKPAKKRLLGLDALRGIAVFLMIEQHLGVWLPKAAPGGPPTGLVVFNALGGGAAPAFVTLAGIGSSLLASKRERPDRTLVLRGLAVMGFGYLLSFLTPSWFSWQTWFVLHLMGFGMLLTPALRRLPTGAVLGLGVAVLLVTGFIQAEIGVPLRLDNPYMSGRSPRSPAQWSALRIALAEGQFPIFPWFSFYLVGVACGRFVVEGKLERIALTGVAAIALGSIGVLIRALKLAPAGTALWRTTTLNVPFFPASPTLVVLLLGIVLLGIWLVMAIDRARPLSPQNPIVTLGRASLTLLIVHVWLFREATRPLGMWRAFDYRSAALVLTGFVLISALLSWLWQKVGYRYGAEWLLRKLAP